MASSGNLTAEVTGWYCPVLAWILVSKVEAPPPPPPPEQWYCAVETDIIIKKTEAAVEWYNAAKGYLTIKLKGAVPPPPPPPEEGEFPWVPMLVAGGAVVAVAAVAKAKKGKGLTKAK